MELKSIGLSQQVWEQLLSIGRQKEKSPLETLEMTLRNHFGLPVPEKWKIDSWVKSGVVIKLEQNFSKIYLKYIFFTTSINSYSYFFS